MKNLLLAISLVSLSVFGYSQEKKEKKENVEVPSVVEKAFSESLS